MNTALGAAIEQSVVDSLNAIRELWDPTRTYAAYTFVRQSQTFPDVLLKTTDPDAQPQILMGIELKGWFAIAKEAEPSARFYANEDSCADADLLVVMPWVFDNVVSGRPRLLKPIIAEAKHVARVRNWWWEFVRQTDTPNETRGITLAPHRLTYPGKADKYSDKAISDSGKNFGRVARCGVIDIDVDATLKEPVLGIPIDAWRKFLAVFSEKATPASINKALDNLASDYMAMFAIAPEYAEQVATKYGEIAEVIAEGAAVAIAAAEAERTARAARTAAARATRTNGGGTRRSRRNAEQEEAPADDAPSGAADDALTGNPAE
ncbi:MULTISPECIES: hypothetical protein [unclassified Burkholderia]|nr:MULTISPECIES: hypothetical protein [unclassified Burkholderia]